MKEDFMLLDNKGFDLWANDYDLAVDLSDATDTYPFAGYKDILATIYAEIMSRKPCKVLDIGIGTGLLATRLYMAGNEITGIDFSEEMLKIARKRMPTARLMEYNFMSGLPDELTGEKFDFIILTYSIHHLSYEQQSKFLVSALDYLAEGGCIMIGDVAFETEAMMQKCREENVDDWDSDEFYIIYTELVKSLGSHCQIEYNQISHCGAIVKLTKLR